MITLNVEDYCQNCMEFDPVARLLNWIPGQANESPKNEIICKHAMKCKMIMQQLEKVKKEDLFVSQSLHNVMRRICKLAGAKFISRNEREDRVDLWTNKPFEGKGKYFGYIGCQRIGFLSRTLFPTLQPGDCICVDEAEE